MSIACTLIVATGFSLRGVDWLVVAAYLLVLLVSGVYFARLENKNTQDYFLGGRSMPMWAVAISILASSLSVATFLGAPQQSYLGNLSYLLGQIGLLVGVVVVAVFFIPVFYRLNCTTIYELLEHRFGPGAKRAASAAFMLGRLFASGARIYIAAIPMALIFFGLPEGQSQSAPWELIAAIVALSAVAVVYTLIGGIASVIWTDVIQAAVMLIAIVAAIVLLLWRIPAPVGEIASALSTAGPDGSSKLAIFVSGLDETKPLGVNWSLPFTVLSAIFGLSLLNMASLGCDHDLTQRMLTCKSALKGSQSVFLSMAVTLPVVVLFLIIGLLLYVFYNRPELMGSSAPTYSPGSDKQVFVSFIVKEMPAGMSGLMIAGLFAVGIGSLNSAINAMAATFIKDFYQSWVPNRPESHYLSMSRWATVMWGVLLAAFAIFCVYWQREQGQTLLDLALSVMTFAYGGLLAVFLTALFTKRGSTTSIIAGLITGFVITLMLQGPIWALWAPYVQSGSWQLMTKPPSWAWHMTIAVPVAMAVCCLGRSGKVKANAAG